MKSINLTPTWEGILPLLIEVAATAETPEGRNIAKAELSRLARYADEMPARIKAMEEQEARRAEAMRSALFAAEAFISGFEDDETQEGISELLESIRSAVVDYPAQAEPVAVLVYVRGGLVQGTSASGPASVFVLDYDTDQNDAECVEIEGENVNAYEEGPKVEPERVNTIRQIIRPTTENPEA